MFIQKIIFKTYKALEPPGLPQEHQLTEEHGTPWARHDLDANRLTGGSRHGCSEEQESSPAENRCPERAHGGFLLTPVSPAQLQNAK